MSKSIRSITVQINVSTSAAVGTAPSWVTDLTVGTWTEVATTNKVSSVNPGSGSWTGNSGQPAVVRAWNGGVLAPDVGTYGTYVVYGGGHHDYHGTEVYGLDLGTKTWARYNDPYSGVVSGSQSAPGGFYGAHTGQPNGAPGTPHTYHQLFYHPGRKSMVSLRCQVNENPSVIAKAAYFPLSGSTFTSYQWQRGTEYSGNPVSTDGWAAYDTTRNLFYTQGGTTGSPFAAFDPSTGSAQDAYGTWTAYSSKSTGSGQSAAYDPVNDIVLLYTPNTGRVRAFSAASPNSSLTQLVLSETLTMGLQCGLDYSPTLGAFIVWGTGNPVYQLRKSVTGDWASAPWGWFPLTTSNAASPPAKVTKGTFGRFRVVTYSNAEVAIVLNAVDQNLHAFRIA